MTARAPSRTGRHQNSRVSATRPYSHPRHLRLGGVKKILPLCLTGDIADGDTRLAASILDQAQPESPDGSSATVSACVGLTLGLLDRWLSGNDTKAPAGLAKLIRLPAGHWAGERAATDILTLARKGRAFAALDALIARQGGHHLLYGSALVLAAALQAWSRHADTPVIDLARTVVR